MFFTETGRAVFTRPTLEAELDFILSVDKLGFGSGSAENGTYVILDKNSDTVMLAVRAALYSRPARSGLTPGIHKVPNLPYANSTRFVFVFQKGPGFREQELYPSPALFIFLRFVLWQDFAHQAALQADGTVKVSTASGESFTLLADNMLSAANAEPGLQETVDVNADGTRDFIVTYPLPFNQSQILYRLP